MQEEVARFEAESDKEKNLKSSVNARIHEAQVRLYFMNYII